MFRGLTYKLFHWKCVYTEHTLHLNPNDLVYEVMYEGVVIKFGTIYLKFVIAGKNNFFVFGVYKTNDKLLDNNGRLVRVKI